MNEDRNTRRLLRRVTRRDGIILLYAALLAVILIVGVGEWFVQATLVTLLAMDLYRTFARR